MKPRIKWVSREWICVGGPKPWAIGHGRTPQLAYGAWAAWAFA